MKWRKQLIVHLTLISQITVLFLAWWLKYLITDNGPLFTSMMVLAIGIIGGIFIWLQANKHAIENKALETTIIIIGSLIITAGAFIAFVPIAAIFMHGAISTVIFITGILATTLLPKLLSYSGATKNA